METKENMKSNKIEQKKLISFNTTKFLVYLITIVIFIGIIFLGIKLSTNFKTQEKITKLGLEDVGELVTQTCYTTVIEDSKVNRDFFKLFDIPFTESRQIFSYDFEVDASVNFDEIKNKKIDDENSTIEVELPHSKIYKTTLNPSSFRVYLDSESLFSRIDLEKHNSAIQKMQDQAQNDCVANKILSSADENAEKLISGIIKGNSKYKKYKINFIYKGGN